MYYKYSINNILANNTHHFCTDLATFGVALRVRLAEGVLFPFPLGLLALLSVLTSR